MERKRTEETGEERPGRDPAAESLLDRLLYKGVLPRYAFPTDIATFHVFDANVIYSLSTGVSICAVPGVACRFVAVRTGQGSVDWLEQTLDVWSDLFTDERGPRDLCGVAEQASLL